MCVSIPPGAHQGPAGLPETVAPVSRVPKGPTDAWLGLTHVHAARPKAIHTGLRGRNDGQQRRTTISFAHFPYTELTERRVAQKSPARGTDRPPCSPYRRFTQDQGKSGNDRQVVGVGRNCLSPNTPASGKKSYWLPRASFGIAPVRFVLDDAVICVPWFCESALDNDQHGHLWSLPKSRYDVCPEGGHERFSDGRRFLPQTADINRIV